MKVTPLVIVVVFHSVAVAVVSTIAPSFDGDDGDNSNSNNRQCSGYDIDFSRLQSLSTDDVKTLMGSNTLVADHTYARMKVANIVEASTNDDNQATPPRCIGTRHRLQENMQGVPIHGADILVTTNNDCLTDDTDDYSLSNYGGSFLNMLADDPDGSSIQRLTGKTFTAINVPNGYSPTNTLKEAAETMATHLGVPLDAVGDPALEVFISTGGDFLAYRSYVIVVVQDNNSSNNNNQGISASAGLVEIVVDAHDLSVLSQCTLSENSSATAEEGNRYLRRMATPPEMKRENSSNMDNNDHTSRSLFNCESCATSTDVSWYVNTTTCTLSSLYLDDTERTTICTMGMNKDDKSIVVGPGPVPDLFWKGTLDCNGGSRCNTVVLPDCRDALSDIQFGGITVMKFLRDHLGFEGGINADAGSPVAVKAYAHYLEQYCNAFYNPSTNAVYFGDCNCRTWSPLASLDIVGHEIFHGVTQHSSKLVYSGQPGGLNEAYSDIFGTILEFSIDDYNDPPDFTIAEQVGAVLRNMEFPTSKSIGSVCSYVAGLNVHYGSGALSKAYVKSVRLCVANGCNDLRGCAMLLGTHLLYSNIHGLTRTSGFLDGAEASCSLVEEFFTVRAPSTTCTPNQVKQFIIDGWATVDVAIDGSTCQAVKTCTLPPSPTPPTPNPTKQPTTPEPTPPTTNPTKKPTTPEPTLPELTPPLPTIAPAAAPTETQDDEVESPSNSDGDVEGVSCFVRVRNALGRVFNWTV